jgi:hypothetical protein
LAIPYLVDGCRQPLFRDGRPGQVHRGIDVPPSKLAGTSSDNREFNRFIRHLRWSTGCSLQGVQISWPIRGHREWPGFHSRDYDRRCGPRAASDAARGRRTNVRQIAVKLSIGRFGFTGIDAGEKTSATGRGATGADTEARPTTAPSANTAKAEKMTILFTFILSLVVMAASLRAAA